MTRYAKRKLKYSLNENFNLLPYVEWDRFVTLTGAQAEWGLRYRIYFWLDMTRAQTYNLPHLLDILNEPSVILPILNIIIVIDETVLLWCWFFIYSNTEIYEKNILKFALPKHTCKNRTRKFWRKKTQLTPRCTTEGFKRLHNTCLSNYIVHKTFVYI